MPGSLRPVVFVALGPTALGLTGSFEAFVWPDEPPADIPFERSAIFGGGVEFTGRYANYEHADTWFPSWAADGSLLTPWTDGQVAGHGASSSCADPGCLSTTGFATVLGDDPFNLNITGVGTFASSPTPYHGRYPSASLAFNGTWFYGTYALDNENHQPGRRLTGADATIAGYCGNWCIQGPFVGFRTSTDKGQSWQEPRIHLSGYDGGLFGEAAPDNHTVKVKFGAVHVLDLGKELEHAAAADPAAPGLRTYVLGHGASSGASPESWMQGSEVYIARAPPTVAAINDRNVWEFYSGVGSWSRDLSDAQPLISWENRTGVTTMTYIPAVQRFIMCISTPSQSPFTNRAFDTYLLESEHFQGPWRYITYMREFGPEAYFVNIPSKFVAAAVDPVDGSLRMMLSYSANFAMGHAAPNPPGSGYQWVLQEIKLHRQSHPRSAHEAWV